MVILGAVVNGICIIFGTLLGKLFSAIPESMKGTIMHAIGLAVTVLGLQMALKSENFLVVILSLVIGTVIGEWLQLEERLKLLGEWLENKVDRKERKYIRRLCNSHAYFCNRSDGDTWCIGQWDSRKS